jgi:hypothetical protein
VRTPMAMRRLLSVVNALNSALTFHINNTFNYRLF